MEDGPEKDRTIEKIKEEIAKYRDLVRDIVEEVEIEPAKGGKPAVIETGPADSTCSPPSVTRAAASTTSCAAAPAARAIRAAPSSTCRSRTT